ncbi:hypothetical protein [Nocardia sp. NPDC024068]|uniref:hypothetical protein n=1 Tax=Nocardia sp. NPDC024068 TaxID=3157197 RepID=UPI0033D41B2A
MRSGATGAWLRSLLPAILVMAVLGMHHLAGGPDHTEPAEPSGHHTMEAVAAIPAVDAADEQCCAAISHPTSAEARHAVPPHPPHDTDPAGHGAGHDLLHLCLAILTALAALALVLYQVAGWLEGTARVRGGSRHPATFARPPPPATSVRLATLGVLRL